jgi:hypothetical protein
MKAMQNLFDRIRKGEEAIAAARAEGRDTSEWEQHLAELKREAVGKLNSHADKTPRAWVIDEVRDEAGETTAVKICSAPLEAHLWILNDPDFIPPDDDPVFFSDEFEYLETKSIADLRGALKTKIAFPRARVVQ